MGTTYSNCQVRSDSQEAVVTALRGLLKEPAYVAPAVNGWVGVYPEGAEATDTLAIGLSQHLATAVFDWSVYDSDVFTYSLYENGELRDEFNSSPGYFESMTADGDEEAEGEKIDPAKVQGDPQALLSYCLPGTTLAAIQEVLHPTEQAEPEAGAGGLPASSFDAYFPIMAEALGTTADALKQGVLQKTREKYVFADHQATDLAELLGITEQLCSASYRDIDGDDVEDPKKEDFLLLGNENLSQSYKDAKLWSIECLQNPTTLSYWLQQGANPNTRDRTGQPVLFRYVLWTSMIEILLAAGGDVNITSTRSSYLDPQYPDLSLSFGYEAGVTALMVVVGFSESPSGHMVKAVRALLDAGADVNARSETGRTALSEALQMTDWKIQQRKIRRRASEESMRQAAGRSAQVVEMLRAAGATE